MAGGEEVAAWAGLEAAMAAFAVAAGAPPGPVRQVAWLEETAARRCTALTCRNTQQYSQGVVATYS